MTEPYVPIAIVGAGCHFPGGRNLDEFTQFIQRGGCAIQALPASRYDASLYYDEQRGAPYKSYCWNGAMLDPTTFATPTAPQLSPDVAARLTPLHKLALGVAAETFASAGIAPTSIAGANIPVILGGGRPSVDTYDRAFAYAIERLVAPLGDTMPDVRDELVRTVRETFGGNADEPWPAPLGRQVSGVVANAYGLTGRHAVIDAACASSFAAIAVAKRALEQRTCDMALVGAAILFDVYLLVLFAQSRALTHDTSLPFDARATGFIPGEGSGMFLLERLDDAIRNRRRILGVIRSVGSSCDGSGKGTWAPRREGQVLAIERAYQRGHVELSEVQAIEAHATSTRLGDATEVAALGEVFGRARLAQPLLLGSIKSNIGHALSAAGAAGLTKVLGSFQTGTIAPSIGYTSPNPDIKWDKVPLRLVTEPTPWSSDGRPRVAALDSFGIGGLNYHVVVEGPPSATRAEELMRGAVAPSRARVAVVGTGVFLPGARNSGELAQVVAGSSGQFRPVPASRTPLELYKEQGSPSRWRTHIVDVAVVEEPRPDPTKLKIPPKLLGNYDPLQFVILDAAMQSMAALKHPAAIDKKRVAVFVGSSEISDFFIELTLAIRIAELGRLLDRALSSRGLDAATRQTTVAEFVTRVRGALPTVTEESSASVGSGLSSRTARTLDINGPVFTIDAGGTGSSLAAFEAGVDALLAGDCDVALVGGGDRALRIDRLAQWHRLAGMSDVCPGEGAAMVALRRLDDAQAAGDTVLGTVLGIGASAAGDLGRAGRPDLDSAERAIARALDRAGIAPATVQYAVTDALGPSADAPDLIALDKRLGDGNTAIPLGSPLPLFGHCDAATGMASMQIALLALGQGAAPGTKLGERAGHRLRGFPGPTPLRAPAEAVAAISASGAWGTHYHVLIGARPAPTAHVITSDKSAAPEPVVFCAASRAALWSALQPMTADDLARVSSGDVIGSGDCAIALRRSTLAESHKVALTALTSPENASFVTQGVAICDQRVQGATCLMLPGLGSPYEGMLKPLVAAYPAAARRLAEIDELVAPLSGRTMTDVLDREPKLFGETVEWAQYASLSANLITFEVASAHGIVPDYVSGHSFGEYAALVIAGAITLETAVRMAAARAEAIARHTRPGAMTSVFASRARIAQLVRGLPGFAAASNINSPEEVVVSGDHEGTAAFLDRCRRENIQAKQLTVPAPFHCELLRPACEPFARAIANVPIARPRIAVISSVTSQVIDDPEQMRRALVEQLVQPVDWIAQIEHAYTRGVRRFVETGAGNVLARLTAKVVGGRRSVIVSFDERRKREKAGLAAVENALVVLRASEAAGSETSARPVVAAATQPQPSAAAESSALFTPDEWRELARQPDWAQFWVQARPSLALFARDLYARSRPGGVAAVAATPARPEIKMFDVTTSRPAPAAQEHRRPPTRPPAAVAPRPAAPPAPAASAVAARPAARPQHDDLTAEVGALLVDLVVKFTGYPRDLVRFEQELEADLGIDTVKQVELLGTIRTQLELAADESITVSDLPTLGHVRDYIVMRLGATPRGTPRETPAIADDRKSLVEEVGGLLVDLVVAYTGYPRDLVRFEQELEADLGIDTVKQVELLGTIRAQLDLPADESVTVSDLPTLAHLRDYIVDRLGGGPRPTPVASEPPTNGVGGDDHAVADVTKLVVELVVKFTGYPPELVRFEQELEADLGIDTVKQVELLGTIRERLELGADESITVSDLPTLAHLRDYVVARLANGHGRPRARSSHRHAGTATTATSDDEEASEHEALGDRIEIASLPGVAAPVLHDVVEASMRFIQRPELEAVPAGVPYRPRRALVVGGGELAEAIAAALAERGTISTRLDLAVSRDDLARALAGDGVPDLCLAAACERGGANLDVTRVEQHVELLRAWLTAVGAAPATLSAVTGLGGLLGSANLAGAPLEGAGLVGMLRALRHEHANVRVAVVDVDAWAAPTANATALLAELDGGSRKLWAGWFRGQRRVPRMVPAPLNPADGPNTSSTLARLRALPYAIVTGGARGITAELALRLAELGVHALHLVGRSQLPADLARWKSVPTDQLRQRVLEDLRARGGTIAPAEWNQRVASIEAALEIDRNLARITAAGARVRYHAVDVADRAKLGELLAAIRRDDGPVRAIVHGAGVQRSRALVGKPATDFYDTLAPKLIAAAHLIELTADDPVEWFACLSSVAGQFGNHGQTDYALASTLLDAIVAAYALEHPNRRAFSISWPAWDEVGMAVRGGTREQLERRGRKLMTVAEGGNHFVRELIGGDDAQVTIAGPTVGDPDEQRPSPELAEALARARRVAAPLPLIDDVLAASSLGVEVEHRAVAAREAYLRDHVLGEVGLMPGVVILELLAEVAAVARGGDRVGVIENVQIELPFKLPRDGHGTVYARARAERDGHAVELVAPHIDRQGRLVEAERVLVRGHACGAAAVTLPFEWRDPERPLVAYRYRTADEAGANKVVHGPSLHTVEELAVGGSSWHGATLVALPAGPLCSHKFGDWIVPAPLFDGCLVTCGVAMSQRGLAGLPRGFGRITLASQPRDRERCRVLVHERSYDQREVHFDFVVRGADQRVLLVVEDFVWRSFATISRDAIEGRSAVPAV